MTCYCLLQKVWVIKLLSVVTLSKPKIVLAQVILLQRNLENIMTKYKVGPFNFFIAHSQIAKTTYVSFICGP